MERLERCTCFFKFWKKQAKKFLLRGARDADHVSWLRGNKEKRRKRRQRTTSRETSKKGERSEKDGQKNFYKEKGEEQHVAV